MRTPASTLPRLPLLLPLALVAALTATSCAKPQMKSTLNRRPTAAEMAQLWVKPDNIASRDLFWGVGGEKYAPKPGTTFYKETEQASFDGRPASF